MKKKLAIIAYSLLISELSYSQSVLVDNNGDTLVAITIQQMDDIYVELIQKDSLMEQAIISSSKEAELYEIVSISENNLKSCQEVLKHVRDNDVKLKRTRKIALFAILFAVFEGLVIAAI